MIREPVVNGTFYPSNPDKLIKDINNFLNNINIPTDILKKIKNPFAFIVPHAGYIYSGQTAAYAYKIIKDLDIDTFILIGPSHNAFINGNSVFPEGEYKTPLGLVDIDYDIGRFLLQFDEIKQTMEAHLTEHSLEVQLPFLQVVKKNFQIVPILVGDYSISNLEKLSEILLETLANFNEKKICLIISTDLSHYHNSETADRIDSQFIQYFKNFQIKELIQNLNENKIEACGAGPIIAMMLTAKTLNKTNVEVLNHTNSGKVTGDMSRVVGYLSAVVY